MLICLQFFYTTGWSPKVVSSSEMSEFPREFPKLQSTLNQLVVGSSPTRGTIAFLGFSTVYQC